MHGMFTIEHEWISNSEIEYQIDICNFDDSSVLLVEIMENFIRCSNCQIGNKNGAIHNTRHRATDNRFPTKLERIVALKELHLRKIRANISYYIHFIEKLIHFVIK